MPNGRKDETMGIFQQMMDEQSEREQNMNFRHPWFNMTYNYLIAAVAVCLIISLTAWGISIRKEHRDAELLATARASWDAERQAEADAKAAELAAYEASEEMVCKKYAEALSKVFFGAKRFQDKYKYTADDFRTLARCVFNRVENKAYSDNLLEVVNQKDQWVGYYETNPVLDEYYQIALAAVKEWRAEETKPVSNDYLWAEFTPNGIWLKNDFNADGYARRWHA